MDFSVVLDTRMHGNLGQTKKRSNTMVHKDIVNSNIKRVKMRQRELGCAKRSQWNTWMRTKNSSSERTMSLSMKLNISVKLHFRSNLVVVLLLFAFLILLLSRRI
nr:hypothetical protein [Crucivirus sp.]